MFRTSGLGLRPQDFYNGVFRFQSILICFSVDFFDNIRQNHPN
jgi:hypothetical protein